jgi:hypothetical protein
MLMAEDRRNRRRTTERRRLGRQLATPGPLRRYGKINAALILPLLIFRYCVQEKNLACKGSERRSFHFCK